MTRVTLTTASTPGAVAIIQLHGERVAEVLQRLTGRKSFIASRAYLCDLAGIDEGLAIQFNDETAQLMPHGGPRVVQHLLQQLTQNLACTYDNAPDTQSLYPEAESPIEADLLDAIAKAQSPAAIDLLAQQPNQWRSLLQQVGQAKNSFANEQRQQISRRSQTLNQLIMPPTVVVAGPANVGKSTLTNALVGKRISIVADLPGTTRDWVGGIVELNDTNNPDQAIAVNWLDTPGLRDSDDAIEQRAIVLAKQQIEHANVLVAIRDPNLPWPDAQSLPRDPDLYVINKVDDAEQPTSDAGRSQDHPLRISASNQRNLDHLQSSVIHRLRLSERSNELWAFSPTLASWCESTDGLDDLVAYV